jgi:hypothetical protein
VTALSNIGVDNVNDLEKAQYIPKLYANKKQDGVSRFMKYLNNKNDIKDDHYTDSASLLRKSVVTLKEFYEYIKENPKKSDLLNVDIWLSKDDGPINIKEYLTSITTLNLKNNSTPFSGTEYLQFLSEYLDRTAIKLEEIKPVSKEIIKVYKNNLLRNNIIGNKPNMNIDKYQIDDSEKDKDRMLAGLVLVCFFYKKKNKLHIIWIYAIIIELLASISLLIYYRLYQ